MLNGKDHKLAKSKGKQFENYISSARTLFRMLWLSHFLQEVFERLNADRENSFAHLGSEAYNAAFGEYHGWMIRASVKTGILMAPS